MKKGFTFIEILVVVTIIGLLAGVGAISYSQFTKSSRDARRKADVENLRAALEMYRSNHARSSYPDDINNLIGSYIDIIPKDPKGNDYTYSASRDNPPVPCDDSVIGSECTSYALSISLEVGESYVGTPYGSGN